MLRRLLRLPEVVDYQGVDLGVTGAEPILLQQPLLVLTVLRQGIDGLALVLAERNDFQLTHSDPSPSSSTISPMAWTSRLVKKLMRHNL